MPRRHSSWSRSRRARRPRATTRRPHPRRRGRDPARAPRDRVRPRVHRQRRRVLRQLGDDRGRDPGVPRVRALPARRGREVPRRLHPDHHHPARRGRRALRRVPRRHPGARQPHHREGRSGLRHQPAHAPRAAAEGAVAPHPPERVGLRTRDGLRMPRHRRLRHQVLRAVQPALQRGLAVPAVHRGARSRLPDRHRPGAATIPMPRAAPRPSRSATRPRRTCTTTRPTSPARRPSPTPTRATPARAFGNLNFWRIWHRWFGDPEAERLPAFFPPCSRLVGGHPCPAVEPTIPAAAALG